jgi:membrane protein required for colicin V production
MNWLDYGIVAVVLLSILIGFVRGFTREFFGLGTWVLAILLAVAFGQHAAAALTPHIAHPLVRAGVAYGGLFLAGLLVGGVLTAVLVTHIRESRFSTADRTLGSGLGLIRGFLFVGLGVLLGSTVGFREEGWWQQSVLISPAQVIADGLDVLIPDAWLDPLRPDAAAVPASETQQSSPQGPATRRGALSGQV